MTKTRDEAVHGLIHAASKLVERVERGTVTEDLLDDTRKAIEAAGVIRPPVGDVELQRRFDVLTEKKNRAGQCVMFPNMATADERVAIAEKNREFGMDWFGARDEAYELAKDAIAALSVSKPAMGELSEDELAEILWGIYPKEQQGSHRPWTWRGARGTARANFCLEQARAILAATTLSPKGDEELVEALEKICGCTDEGVKNPISSHVMRDIARDALSRHQARLNGEG